MGNRWKEIGPNGESGSIFNRGVDRMEEREMTVRAVGGRGGESRLNISRSNCC